jgi:hypothetical protein
MAHDMFDLKAELYLYDKIFHKEFNRGNPAVNIMNIPEQERNTTVRNQFLINYVRKHMETFPTYTVEQFNALFHKELNTADWLRYFKDFIYKQTDLPVKESLIIDMYHKLFGIPINKEAAFGHSNRLLGRDIKKSGRLYKHNIYERTKMLLQENPTASNKDLEKIIYSRYPIEAELLLDYAKKYAHFMK